MTLPEDNTAHRSAYRKDIDGLRAIAVLAVIVNHFASKILPSGYLGVDIFFAISGFVITSSLVGRKEATLGEFILAFYSRRIRRLWPGLLLCITVTAIVICFFELNPTAPLRIGIAAAFGVSNMYLLKEATDYFGSWASLNAFTHTWSLGVEEQFYIVFPLLYWFGLHHAMGRRRVVAATLMTGTLFVSLAAFLYYNNVNQPVAFFLMPNRWWELMAGCLTFLAYQAFRKGFWVPLPLVLAVLLGVTTLPERYEATGSIVAVICTCLLLFAVRENDWAYRLLTLRPLVYIGLLSYSLYLWHWVVLIVCRWTVGVRPALIPIEVGVAFLIAALAYHNVELPLRRQLWFNSKRATVMTGLAGSVVASLILLILANPVEGKLYAGIAQQDGKQVPLAPSSHADGAVVLIGDSHAWQFTILGQDIASRYGKHFTLLSTNATPFPTSVFSTPNGGLTLAKSRNNARNMSAQVDSYFRSNPPDRNDLIILASFYMRWFSTPLGARRFEVLTHYDADGRQITDDQALQGWLDQLETFSQQHSSQKIVVVLSTPEMPDIYPEELCQKQWFRPRASERCFVQVNRAATIARLAKINGLIRDRASRHPNMLVYDPLNSLCPESETMCSSTIGGDRIYKDEDHLNEAGSMFVEKGLEEFLDAQNVASKTVTNGLSK